MLWAVLQGRCGVGARRRKKQLDSPDRQKFTLVTNSSKVPVLGLNAKRLLRIFKSCDPHISPVPALCPRPLSRSLGALRCGAML